MIPLRLRRPRVGRNPTRLCAEAGDRTDCPVSLPVPAMAKLAAIAAPVPPLEPPGVRLRSYGFRVCPPRELTVVPPRASSIRFAFASISAPASRNFLTTKASRNEQRECDQHESLFHLCGCSGGL